MNSIRASAVLSALVSLMLALPALSQQSDCAQVDKAQPVCGLTTQQITGLKSLAEQFQNQNKKPNIAIPETLLNCVIVDHFKPACGLTTNQLAEVSRQIDAYKRQTPQ